MSAPLSDFVTLSCPTCGGQLRIANDIERFACAYCGNEHVVRRAGGLVTLAPVVKGLVRVQRGTDRTASELAIRRLNTEIPALQRQLAHLAGQLLPSDFGRLSRRLLALNKLSRQQHRALQARREQDCLRLAVSIGRLSGQELKELIRSYNRGLLPSARRKRQVVRLVRLIHQVGTELNAKQAQLAQHGAVVNAPLPPSV